MQNKRKIHIIHFSRERQRLKGNDRHPFRKYPNQFKTSVQRKVFHIT